MDEIIKLIKTGDAKAIAEFMKTHDLILKDGKIYPAEDKIDFVKSQIVFYDQRQQARKILLNSLYGALLNEAMRLADPRMGQSVTLTGRSIVRHMNAQVNEEIEGVYDYVGDAILYSDTDSISFISQILTNNGSKTIEDLFLSCSDKWTNGEKEYATDPDLRVMSFNPVTDRAELMPINYIYRHRVSKPKWRITDQQGNSIDVTGDHSVMIERDDVLMEIKPRDMKQDDIIISIK